MNAPNKKVKIMTPVSEEKKRFYGSTRLTPHVNGSEVPSDSVRKLFFSSTTISAYSPSNVVYSSSSYSDVHKASQKLRPGKAPKAPFWSREMTRYVSSLFVIVIRRYHQAFIPLPLDGAVINKELARTFNPNDADATEGKRSLSVPSFNRTRYAEDFCLADLGSGFHRPPSMKPKSETHVKEDSKLLYTDSMTHEAFQKPPLLASHKQSEKPVSEDPPKSLPFCGKSRYSEEFVSKEGYKVELFKGHDKSNRIVGNSIPNRIKEYIYDHELTSVTGLDVDSIMKSKEGRKIFDPKSVYYENPYLSDYMNT